MNDPYEQISDSNEIDRLRRERAEEAWRGMVDRKIEEAQKKGSFDNLPGQGKPLNLQKNPHAGERALAYELLQNNDYTLPWIAERSEILAAIAAFRADLTEALHRHHARLRAAGDEIQGHDAQREWRATLACLERDVAELNKRVSDVNLTIPVERLEVLKLNLDKELARLGAARE